MSFLFCEESVLQSSDLAKLMCSSRFLFLWVASFGMFYKSFEVQLFAGETNDDEVQSQSASLGHMGKPHWEPRHAVRRGTTWRWDEVDEMEVWRGSPWYDTVMIPSDTIGHLGTAASLKRGASCVLQRSLACLTVYNAVVFYLAQAWRAPWR